MIAVYHGWAGGVQAVTSPASDDWEEAREQCRRRLEASKPPSVVVNTGALTWARHLLREVFPDCRKQIDETLTPAEIVEWALELI